MTRLECTHEPAVVNAVLSGQWPRQADETLIAHAMECEVCREVASITTLIHDDSERSRYEVHVPAAGQVWWRAAVRARLDSTQASTRPITWLHAITAAAAVGVLLALIGAAWPVVVPTLERAWAMMIGYFPSAEVATAVANGLRLSAMLGVIAAALLVVAPLALYYVLSDE